MCCVYPVWKVLGPVGSWRARRSPWGPFNRNHTRADTSHLLRWDHKTHRENVRICTHKKNPLSNTVWYTGRDNTPKKMLPRVRVWMQALLLWMNCPTRCWVPQNQWPQTRPGNLYDAQYGAHDPAWNRKWAGKARILVCWDGSFLRLSITTVFRDLLFCVTHLQSMCFWSTVLGFSWWLQIDGPSYPMWEDRKVLYGYKGVIFSGQPSAEW